VRPLVVDGVDTIVAGTVTEITALISCGFATTAAPYAFSVNVDPCQLVLIRFSISDGFAIWDQRCLTSALRLRAGCQSP